MLRLTPLLLLNATLLLATQEFTLETMKQYLTPENPYIYAALGKKYISKEQLNTTQGLYDTRVVAKYDKKEYPTTTGTYYDMGVKKATEFGAELSLAYRYAEGTQEYNNIKTGKNGEFIVGANMPLISLLNRIDARKLKLSLAKLDLEKTHFAYKESMRHFYFSLMSNYYTLLYKKELVLVSQDIVKKIQKREQFLQKSVTSGNAPQMALIETAQQLLNAKQENISTQRDYENSRVSFVKYLTISLDDFTTQYHLPKLPQPAQTKFQIDDALFNARKNRADIQILNTEVEKLLLEHKNNERAKYPAFTIGVYGVQDINEKSGFKVALDLEFPVAQNQYYGKKAQIKERMKLINNTKELQLLEIRTDLVNVINSLNTLMQNIQNSKKEIQLLQKLESLENKKYKLGASTLFLLNQRELLTLQAHKKVLHYRLQYQLLYESYKRIISSNTLMH